MSSDQEGKNNGPDATDPAADTATDPFTPAPSTSAPSGESQKAQAGADQDSELEKLKAELAAAKDQLLRGQAEMQNVRRRAEQDVEKAHKFALDKFSADIIVVADNLERALDTAQKAEDAALASFIEGMELTLKSLLDTLEKHGVQPLNPAGAPFDPQVHEAIAMVPNPAMEPNSVMEVMQKGYSLNGRVIRPARVVVVKGDNE